MDRRDSFADWSLNASIAYDYHADHRVYLRAAQGFRAPQATELYRLQQGQSRARLDSEELDSLELGLRGSWSRVEYDVQAWLMKKSNVIFQDSDRQNISGARTEHQGIDLALTVQMSATVELAVTYSYALHRYDGNIELLGSRVDIDGNDIDTAPRHTASARALWLPRPDTQLELEWVHLGRYYTDPANAHRYPGHDLVNMRAYQQLNPQLRIGMRVTNLLDEEYAERADFGFGNERYFVGEPISTYVDIEYRWGDG